MGGDRFEHALPNLNFPETPPRVAPHTSPPRVAPPTPPVQPTSRVEPHNGPASRTRSKNPNFRSVAQEVMLRCVTDAKMKFSPRKLSSRRFPIEMINAVLNEETGELMEYRHIMNNPKYFQLYATSYSKDLGRLAQGIPGQSEGTNTIYFIDKADIPVERWKDVTYGRVVVSYRPKKSDPYQTRLTVVGNLIAYPGAHRNPARVAPPAPTVPPTPILEPHNGPASRY